MCIASKPRNITDASQKRGMSKMVACKKWWPAAPAGSHSRPPREAGAGKKVRAASKWTPHSKLGKNQILAAMLALVIHRHESQPGKDFGTENALTDAL